MNILFTGASSFTGYWFVKELAEAGHSITATFTQSSATEYSGSRLQRVNGIVPLCESVWSCEFGSPRFLDVAKTGKFDVLCHHAAEVGDYKSPNFNVLAACQSNTRNVDQVVSVLENSGCQKIVITGTVFEPREGAGSGGLLAGSPYGLSKGLTFEVLQFCSQRAGMKLLKFVIPNPFGPMEDERFTHYLMKLWLRSEEAFIRTPQYVRDNIHVSLLAAVYRLSIEQHRFNTESYSRVNPSQYAEMQGSFTRRFADEMRHRLPVPCQYTLMTQTDFSEPMVRINTDPATLLVPQWNEKIAWDSIADYYQSLYSLNSSSSPL